jgi:hypothetical protein
METKPTAKQIDLIDYAIFGGFCWLVYQAYSVYLPFLWNLLP